MQYLKEHPRLKLSLIFVGKTLFYTMVILTLVYLYHFKNIHGGTFIYNEF